MATALYMKKLVVGLENRPYLLDEGMDSFAFVEHDLILNDLQSLTWISKHYLDFFCNIQVE